MHKPNLSSAKLCNGMLLLFLMLSFLPFLSYAQAPQNFSYQGVARNASGSVIANDGIYIKILLRQISPSGTVVYSEEHPATTNEFGLFTLRIGAGINVTGDFSAVNWGNGPYYLETQMDATGGTNFETMGNSQLLSVPYALYAANAGSGGNPGPAGPAGPTGAQGAPGPQGVPGIQGATGNDGATGPQGPTGAAGTNGNDGVTGPQGATGAAGTNGSVGATGPQGTTGVAGTNGNDGATGPQGLPGSTGPTGETGATGETGPTGAAGINGNDGATGPQGLPGSQGATGETGPTGAAGTNGNDGATGPQGATGAAGTNGNDGATGPQGPTGVAGTNGNDGATGPQGATGAAGTNGNDGATGPQGPTGAAGTNGNDGATGPQGATGVAGTNGNDGATGPQGPTGAAGTNGNDGATGPQGSTGAQGATGATGATGNNGATGATGLAGVTGAIGVTGNTGATGTAGNNGATGATGATGNTGATGTAGTNGNNGATGAQGATGATGNNGVTGATGLAGATGTTGATGNTGATGATGTAGNNGATGITGATGATGNTGLAGATGATGVTGPAGADGADGTSVQIQGSVATSGDLPGSGNTTGDGYITQDNGHLWVWDGSSWVDAGLIQGQQGTTGPAGANGSNGATGATGTTGANGVTGATGADGTNGATGATGATGTAGTNGTNGVTGAAGATGPTGPTGVGTTGATGPTGADGALTAWSLTGNTGTVDGTNFIGTTDNKPLNFKIDGQKAGRIDVLGNTFMGYHAGESIDVVNAEGNVAIGQSALRATTSGAQNIASGKDALYYNTSGSYNIASGSSAMYFNETGENNIGIGNSALLSNLTGTNNIAIGHLADVGATNLTNATAIGANAMVSQSNSMVLGNNVNVGIGSSAPGEKLDVSGAIKIGTTAATANGTIRYTGTDFEGRKAGSWVSLTGVGTGYWTASGNNIYSSNSGNVGIGTTAPIAKLDVKGGNIALNQNKLLLKAGNDQNHYIGYNADLDGVRVQGFEGGVLSGTSTVALRWLGNGFIGAGTMYPDAQVTIASTGSDPLHVFNGGYEVIETGINTNGNYPMNFGPWQSFTSTVTGSLTKISIDVSSADMPGDAHATIHSGTGLGGPLLGSCTVSISGPGWVDFPFTGVNVTSGQVYTVQLVKFTGSPYWGVSATCSYAGGSGGDSYNLSGGGCDFNSRIYINGATGSLQFTSGGVLDLYGTFKLNDGTQGSGKILTSDVSGNASWQTNGGSYWTASGNDIYTTNSGSAGIGAVPALAESKFVIGPVNTGDEGGQIQFNASGGWGPKAYFMDVYKDDFRIMDGTTVGSANVRMFIDELGNVGIGTITPQRKLHVSDVMRLQPRSSAPASPGEGDIYMNSVTHKLMVYDGTTWQACW